MQDQNLKSLLKKASDHAAMNGKKQLATKRATDQAWLDAKLKIRTLFPTEAWKYLEIDQTDECPGEMISGKLVIFQDVPITFVVKRVVMLIGDEMQYFWEPLHVYWLKIEGKEAMMVESDPLIAIAQANAWSEYGE